MSEDTLKMLGKIIPEDADVDRDAVHIAVLPVISDEDDLTPGDMVRVEHGTHASSTSHRAHAIGIVDPFLRRSVLRGQRFWVYLFPGSITSLKHVWTHPALPEETTEAVLTDESELNFLRKLAENPADKDTRNIYADWLYDQGRFEEATKQREWKPPVPVGPSMEEIHEAEVWMDEMAEGHGLTRDELIEIGHNGGRCGYQESLCDDLRNHSDTFWRHWKTLTQGKPPEHGSFYFSCAC